MNTLEPLASRDVAVCVQTVTVVGYSYNQLQFCITRQKKSPMLHIAGVIQQKSNAVQYLTTISVNIKSSKTEKPH